MPAEPVADLVGSGEALSAIFLCGIMGLLGQGIRSVIGLKNANALQSTTPNSQSAFSAAYLVLSLMIGFIAGILAGIGIGLNRFTSIDLSNLKLLLGVAASGYVGADFVENSLSLVIPASTVPTPTTPMQTPTPATTQASLLVPATAIVPVTQAAAVIPVATPDDGSAILSSALRIVCPGVNTSKWVPELTKGFAQYGLTTNRRKAAAIGQFLVEAGASFQELVENLHYSAERAAEIFHTIFPTPQDASPFVGNPETFGNHVYANRNGNGNEASGDGFRFRGRGLIQLTGRTEYTDFGKTIGQTAEEAAAYCETREGAAMSGCWYLESRDCLRFADRWDINAVTMRVNGRAMVGAAQRAQFAESMLKHLGG